MWKKTALALGLALLAAPASAKPANTLNELWDQLGKCLAPLRIAAGTDVTIQFSLNRRGGLIGKPRITHAHWAETEDPKHTAAAIAEAFGRCLPAEITDGLGGAIAGRQIVYRLQGRPPDAKV